MLLYNAALILTILVLIMYLPKGAYFLLILIYVHLLYCSPFLYVICFQFVMFETAMTALADEFPHIIRHNKAKATLALCVVFFLLGLPQCTEVNT